LGWRMDNEEWFNADWINSLKIRAGAGKSATSAVSAFQYLNLMNIATQTAIFGTSNQSMIYTGILGNPDLTWAKASTYNAGIDMIAWKGMLGVELDVFYKYQYDLLGAISG